MVSDTYEPTKKEKQQAQQSYKAKVQSKDLKRLKKTTKDYQRLHQSRDSTKDSRKPWQMAIQSHQ